MDNINFNRLDGVTKSYVDYMTGISGAGATGPTGPSGSSGTSGISGTSGSSGTSGATITGPRVSVPSSSWLLTNMVANSGSLNNNTFVANSIYLAPFVPQKTIQYTALSIRVQSAAAGTNVKIMVYNDVNGLPVSELIESTALSKATTGLKTYTVSGTFTAGVQYWLGVVNDTATGGLTTQGTNAQASLPIVAANPQDLVYNFIVASSYAIPVSTINPANITAGLDASRTPLIYITPAILG